MSVAAHIVDSQSTSGFKTKHQPRSTMNTMLWITQVLWGAFFSFTGFGKILCYRTDVWNLTLHQPVAWFHAVPQGLMVFIGVSEFLGGVGLILPAMTRVKPILTPLAGFGLALVMLVAAIFHIMRGEFSFFVPMNLVLGGLAAFIGFGRLMVKPIAAASINTVRMLAGFLVFASLALVGFAPIWYQLTRTN
jgi:hypothetical protein